MATPTFISSFWHTHTRTLYSESIRLMSKIKDCGKGKIAHSMHCGKVWDLLLPQYIILRSTILFLVFIFSEIPRISDFFYHSPHVFRFIVSSPFFIFFIYSFTSNRVFARRSTHLYAHEFAMPLGFLFVWRGIEKNNKKRLNFWFTSWKELKFLWTECVCWYSLSLSCNLVLCYELNKKF